MTTFKLNARNVVRFAKKKSLMFAQGNSERCAVGRALRAFGVPSTDIFMWHWGGLSEEYAKKMGLTVNQMWSIDAGFEDKKISENDSKRYFRMGQNIKKLAMKENMLEPW